MRIIMLLLFSYTANATNYYVKNGGSDVANGLTDGTAWATISKVNSTAISGDSVFFNRGSSWNEKLIPASSNIYYGAYGSGEKPLITGFVSVSGFSDSSNIKTKVLTSSAPKLNSVYIDGSLRGKGRLPNTGYTQTATSPTMTTLSTSLTGTPDYTGAEVAARLTHWIIDVHKIVLQSSGTLTIDEPFSRSPGYAFGGNGFFLLNDLRFLDVNYEWALDSASRTLRIRATSTPAVKVSNIDTLVFISKKDFLTFENISFEGANKTGFQIDTSYTVKVINCTIKDMGGAGITGLKCNKFTLQNDSIFNCLDNGVSFWPYSGSYIPVSPELRQSDSCLFDNNYFKNIGFIAGMGGSGNVHYEGLMSVGDDCVITNNRMDSIGYSAIYFNGQRTLIKNNYITKYCFLKDDGAAIQSGLGGSVPNTGSIVESNIITNGIGNGTGCSNTADAAGIYIDDHNVNTTVYSNTVSNTNGSAIFMHNNDSCTITNNTLVNSIGYPLRLVWVNPDLMQGFVIKHNITYSGSTSWACIDMNAGGNSFGISDSNYISRPLSDVTKLNLSGSGISLAAWQSTTGQDINSHGTPPGISAATPVLYYNPGLSDSTITLSGAYIGAKGELYYNRLTLGAFQSRLLFKASAEISPTSIYTMPYKIIQR